jgi:hypothetical protein
MELESTEKSIEIECICPIEDFFKDGRLFSRKPINL